MVVDLGIGQLATRHGLSVDANRPVGTLASQGFGEEGAARSSWETPNIIPEREKDDDDGDPFGFGQLGFDDDDR